MPSERIQRQIDRLLDEAEQAAADENWTLVLARSRHVLRLDPENEEAQAFLAAAEREPVGAPVTAPPASATTRSNEEQESSSVPESFASGRYAVKKFLGEGGKKKVYLAHDTLLDRDVAFALIKMEGLDDAGRDRIKREAQAMGRLGSQPHIVSVFDMGEENGQPFIVTELMVGGDVERLIEKAPEHRPPLERTLTIATAVCGGLAFAHEHGIVHRDLKPGNVWLTADGTAKLGDFGLAVALDRSRLTQAGMMVGTVSYMPPEQATGGEVTPRSDLYSLGAMLYEMVTGRPPFVGDESVAIIGQHLNTPPVAPTWHNPTVPPGLEALILRLLEKDPRKRPGSAGEVQAALESVAEHLSSRPPPPRGKEESSSPPLAGEGLGERSDNPLYRRVFVGREQEVRQLQSAFDAALSGKGALAMVVGEPGIGKTALCEQLATYVTLRGGTTLYGHCYEEGSLSLPYLAFVEALRSYVQNRPPEALRQELGTAATDVARIVSEVRERLSVEPRPPGDPEEDRWRLLQAVSGFLRNASTVQPLLIVLEDLHWADRGTLDLLLHLARNLQGARLLVIGTYRDVEVDRGHPLSATLAELRRSAEFRRVLLRGLGTPEVQRMLVAITGAELPGSLAESIHRQTEGNPLFVQEVVRYLVEEGHLGHGGVLSPRPLGESQGEGRAAPASLAAMSIPEGLRDVIGKRLSRLSPDCNRVLAVAAVIGRDFGLEILQAIAGLEEEALVSALEDAVQVGVLEESASGRPGGMIRYRFAHAFFRQTLYEELSAPRRLRIHQEVARALEQQYATRLEEHAAELAEHFAQSTDRDDLAKAVRYGELAAQRALAVYAYGEAARHLEQALEVQEVLDPDDKTKRCDLLLSLGEALASLGETTRAVQEVAPEALRLAEALDDRRRASRACRIAHRVFSPGGTMLGEAPRWAQLADRYADEGTIDRAYADDFLGRVAGTQGRTQQAQALFRRAVGLSRRLNDASALVMSAMGLVNGAFTRPEEHEERIALAEELAGRSLEGIQYARLATTLIFLGGAFLTWGRRDAAELHWQRAREAAVRSRNASMAFAPFQIDALVRTLDGELERAVESAAQLRARGEELAQDQGGRLIGARAARRALIYLGRTDETLSSIADLPDLFAIGGVYAGQRALCLAHVGRSDAAKNILHAMITDRDMSSHEDPTSAAVMRYLLEAAVMVRDVEACRVLGTRMAPLAGLLHTEADMCYNIGRLCGGAAVLLGDPEKARGYYQQALEICEKVRFRPEIALTRLELAELLLGQAGAMNRAPTHGEVRPSPSPLAGEGRVRGERLEGEGRPRASTAGAGGSHALPGGAAALRAEALGHLDFAIAEFREMKMQPSLERALRHKDVLKA